MRLIVNRGEPWAAGGQQPGLRGQPGAYARASRTPTSSTARAPSTRWSTCCERRPAPALAVPRMHYEDGALHTSAGDLPDARRGAARAAGRNAGSAPVRRACWWDGWAHDEERRIGRGPRGVLPRASRAPSSRSASRTSATASTGRAPTGTPGWPTAGWEAGSRRRRRSSTSVARRSARRPARWIVSSHRGMYRYFADRHPAWRPWLAPGRRRPGRRSSSPPSRSARTCTRPGTGAGWRPADPARRRDHTARPDAVRRPFRLPGRGHGGVGGERSPEVDGATVDGQRAGGRGKGVRWQA